MNKIDKTFISNIKKLRRFLSYKGVNTDSLNDIIHSTYISIRESRIKKINYGFIVQTALWRMIDKERIRQKEERRKEIYHEFHKIVYGDFSFYVFEPHYDEAIMLKETIKNIFKLSPKKREVMELVAQEWTTKEISESIKVSEYAVKKRIYEARKLLR